MTSFAAWVGVDSRGPSSFYFASDSRITWPGSASVWDSGRKVFASHVHPDIFGYAGDVLFPSIVLGQALDLADTGLLFGQAATVSERQDKLVGFVEESFDVYPPTARGPFIIAHCSRFGSGVSAQFQLRTTSWSWEGGWKLETHPIPEHSDLALCFGSGRDAINSFVLSWKKSEAGGTSRAIFSAFCDSLQSRTDPLSGGAPQLVGIYRTGAARAFGVITDKGPFLFGSKLTGVIDPGAVEWRNSLFERCDGSSLAPLPGAQRQPRPRDLTA